jgi:hypothetical protein
MDTETLTTLAFALMLGLVIVWFVLIKLLFNRLERAHPKKYEAMGRPSLFLRNNIATGWATLKFLFAREHRQLGDRYLSRLSDSMLVYLSLYLVLFFSSSFMVARYSVPAA